MSNDSKVARYNTVDGGSGVRCANGEYVQYADYAEQASTIAALKEQLAGARNAALGEAARLCETEEILFDISVWNKTKQGVSGETALALAKAIRALASQPAAPVQPEVVVQTEVQKLAQRLQWMGVSNFGFTPGDKATPEDVAKVIILALDHLESPDATTPAAPPVQQPDDVRDQVGCEGDDGLLRVHAASTTCDVCSTTRPGAALMPLPPLPTSCMLVGKNLDGLSTLYSAQQMHAYAQIYARAILAASGGAEHVVPHPEITPMFLLNAAMCIESPGDCTTRSKHEVLAKLHRLSAEMQDEKMKRIQSNKKEG